MNEPSLSLYTCIAGHKEPEEAKGINYHGSSSGLLWQKGNQVVKKDMLRYQYRSVKHFQIIILIFLLF